jgi:hypothetical protein
VTSLRKPMRLETKKRKNGGTKEDLSLVQIYILFISISARCVLLGWNQRAKEKEGELFSELYMISLPTHEIQNEETKEQR